MQIVLNSKQSESLANFFFDMAKGLILGGLGLAVATPLEVKITVLLPSLLFAVWFVRIALSLLEEVK